MNPAQGFFRVVTAASNCAMENAVTDTCFCGRSERHTKTEGCLPTPSIQLPSGTERERGIIEHAKALAELSVELIATGMYGEAATGFAAAARILRGITND